MIMHSDCEAYRLKKHGLTRSDWTSGPSPQIYVSYLFVPEKPVTYLGYNVMRDTL